MSNGKQTAVDWLIEQIVNRQNGHGNSKSLDEIFIQAKAIEKQQIVEAFDNGLTIKMGGEQYYSQTYSNHE